VLSGLAKAKIPHECHASKLIKNEFDFLNKFPAKQQEVDKWFFMIPNQNQVCRVMVGQEVLLGCST